ncbi:hypothetical protein [Morganella psychrotolerans]|uniref:gp53-like domain-containing protein n=1 Tax=Morganella psychrotolerans TaxID=368603 RepID=UPI0039B0682D
MKKIGDVTSTADKNGEWTNGNVAAGIPPTVLESGWLNSVQREILGVLTKAGIPQDKNNDNQLSEAISKIITGGNYATVEDLKKKLTKDQNGADIPDKPKFIENLGLGEAAKSGLKQTTGTSKTEVMSQDGVTKALAKSLELTGGTLTGPLSIKQDGPAFVILPTTKNGSCYIQGRDSENKAVWFIGNPTDGGSAIYFRNYLTGAEVSLHVNGISLNKDTYINGTLELSNYSTFDARYSRIRTIIKGDSGYEKDENTGLIRQWGRTTPFAAGNGYPAKFPIPFPSKCTGVGMLLIRSSATTTGSNESVYTGEPGLSGVQLYHGGNENYPAYWEALGY